MPDNKVDVSQTLKQVILNNEYFQYENFRVHQRPFLPPEQRALHRWKLEKVEIMIASLPEAIQKLNTDGYLSDQFMDEKRIMKSTTTVQRDCLVLNRGYAQILSHGKC